jgi:ATP-dependent Clp protease ATP-binding subunit ClpA
VFERFTREARNIVTSAIDEAARRGDSRIGTEHVLISMAGAQSLAGIFPTPAELRSQLDRLDEEALRSVGLDPGLLGVDHKPRPGVAKRHIPFTGAAKDLLKGALKEALALGHRHIGALHLALALTTADRPDRALATLESLGLSPEGVRSSLLLRTEQAS